MREENPSEQTIASIAFDQEGGIQITWIVESENDDDGGTLYQSVITPEGQKASEEIVYWTSELRQSADELLARWRRYKRGKK
jgi:hypothetical protein